MSERKRTPPRRRGGPDVADPDGANARFLEDIARIPFCFRCVDCVHYALHADRCSLEFESYWLTTPELRMCTDDGRIVFCKYFDLD